MRKQLWKRVSALVLALVMVATSLPLDTLVVHAEEAAGQLVNIAMDEGVTVDTAGGNANRRQYINDGHDTTTDSNHDHSTQLFGGSISGYKSANADKPAAQQLPWVSLSFAGAKSGIEEVVVKTLPDNSGNYGYKVNIYGKNGEDEWTLLKGDITLDRASTQEDSICSVTFEEAQTLTDILVNVDASKSDCWPILNEIEVYQRQTAGGEAGGEEGGETPDKPSAFDNIAADCTITVPSEGQPADNMVDGDTKSLWVAADGNWPSTVSFKLPGDNTRKVKKVVVKFEEGKEAWTVDVKLQHALNGIMSDLVNDNEVKNHSFTKDYVYEYPAGQNYSDTIITLSNPKNNGAAGGFYPAIAEVEIWVENEEEDVKVMNVAPSATVTSVGGNAGTKANLVDENYGSLYVFYSGGISGIQGEAWVQLELDREYPVHSMELAVENMGSSDGNNFQFTFDVLGKGKDDAEWAPLFTNVTANRLSSGCIKELPLEVVKNLKYVKIVLTSLTSSAGDPWPALAEFKVFADNSAGSVEDAESIAYGKPVHSNVNSDTVSRVNDGSVTNVWSGSRYPAYIDIDLEENYNLSEIQVFTPSAGYSQYSIYTSMDGRDFTKLAEKTSKDSCPEEGESYDATGTEARIVRVYVEYQSQSTKSLVNEIRVLGTPSDTAVQSRPEIDIPKFEDSKYNVEITAQDTYDEVYGIIERQVGAAYKDWFTLELAAHPEGKDYDYFELSTVGGKVHVKGNDGVSLATGINHFLKYFCQVNISQVGNQVNMPETIPTIEETVFKETKAKVRYSYNYCTLSYSMAFWGEPEWRNELDWLALNGVNVVLDATAQEEVWRRFLTELGYTHAEIKDFIAGPAYYAWAYMANLSGFGGPVHDSWFSERTELARKNQLAMRKLGMQPVLQGYSGMVPNDIQDHDSDAVIIKQGTWCSFQRPDMLKTDDPCFRDYAAKFYAAQKEVYGDVSDYYATDPFHEGGNTGGMDSRVISRIVLEEMIEADETAIWIIQAWQGNPTTALLNGLDDVENGAQHALVLDLYAEKSPHNQETGYSYGDTKEFDDTPWLYCMLNNFGGRLGMHGHLDNMATKIPEALNNAKHMAGIGITPEASVNNPVLYDFIFETVWQDDAEAKVEPIDLDTWLDDYATRRYGAESEAANQAWDILKETTYKSSLNNLGQGAPESVVNARPNLSIGAASTWGNAVISYDKEDLEKAAELLLEDYDTLKDSEGYLYDVATVLQQVLSNSAQEYHSKMANAYSSRNLEEFNTYADKFLGIIDAMEKVTATSEYYLLGRWVEMAKAMAKNADDFTKELYEFNAKALITTWGSYDQAISGGLKDYSNRQWSGLINDYYKARWERWITARRAELSGEQYEANIDWFEMEWSFARGNTVYTTTPTPQDFSVLGEEILTNYGTPKNPAKETKYDIPTEGMTATTGSYQPNNTTEGPASYALDNNPGTIWHTNWGDSNINNAWVNIKLAEPATVNGIRYLPRSGNANVNGKITKFDVYVKVAGQDEYQLVLDDQSASTDTSWQWFHFDEVKNVTDVKFVAVATNGNNKNQFAAAAELRVMRPIVEDCPHTNTKDVAEVAPTCTTAGKEVSVYCEDCEMTISGGKVIPALGHDWSEWTVVEEATTEAAGKEERTCQRTDCGEKEEREIPKLNKPGEIVAFDENVLAENAKANSEQLPAAYTNDGGAAWGFLDNGNWWHSRYQDWDQKGDHEVGSAFGDGKPTETNPIWIQTGFDKVWTVDSITYVPRPNGHGIINQYEVSVAKLADPTAEPTDDDFTVVKEGNLEMITEEQTIKLDEAVEATHVRITVYDAFDGGSNGDGHVAAKLIKIYGYDAVTVDPKPPVEDCKHTETETVNAKDATCTEAGYTGDKVCKACEETVETGEAIEAKGHTAVAVAGKDATCTETGLTEGSKCSVCDEVLVAQEVIQAKGHGTTELVGKVAATCTTPGNTGSEICKVCDKVVKVGAVIEKLGHDFPENWTVVKEPTTEAEGKEERQCTRCDVKEERTIAKLEQPECTHKETEIVGAKDATCTEKGHTGDKVCKECNKVVEAGKEIAALGHDWSGKWTVVKEATTKEEGLEERQCTRCDVKQQRAIDKLTQPEKEPDDEPSEPSQPQAPAAPATGDTANVISMALMMLAAVCGVLVMRRRKIQ